MCLLDAGPGGAGPDHLTAVHQILETVAEAFVDHQAAVEIKGATLTELKVEKQDDGLWLAQCVVDV